MKLKMKLKSVSSLILLMGTLSYAAMQISVSAPNAGLVTGPQEQIAAPQKTVRSDVPRQEKAAPRHQQVYFAKAQ